MQNIKCKTEVITLTHSSSTPLCLWPTQTTRCLQVGQKMGTVKDQLLAKLLSTIKCYIIIYLLHFKV